MQRIALVVNQIKENIKGDMWRCHQHAVQKNQTTYVFIFSKMLLLIIYYFKVCVVFIKEAVILS